MKNEVAALAKASAAAYPDDLARMERGAQLFGELYALLQKGGARWNLEAERSEPEGRR